MNYKPAALDVDRMDGMFDMCEKLQRERRSLEIARVEAFDSGYRAAIDDCRCSLSCSNYELQIPTEREVIRTAFYELCKELNVRGSDIYDNQRLSLDEIAATLAERIKNALVGAAADDDDESG